MKILFVTELSFFQPWFKWLTHRSPVHDLLVIAGGLLEPFHPVPQEKQIEWISDWITRYPRPLCISSDLTKTEWRSEGGPDDWLANLQSEKRWTRPGIFEWKDTSVLLSNGGSCLPDGKADIWVSPYPPADSDVALSTNRSASGNLLLNHHLKERNPRILLCGGQDWPLRWRGIVNQTLCLNPGSNMPGNNPNYVLIDTKADTALWFTCNSVSVYLEKVPVNYAFGESPARRSRGRSPDFSPFKYHKNAKQAASI